jgi:hypothetical protein
MATVTSRPQPRTRPGPTLAQSPLATLNGDGRLDLAVSNFSSNNVTVLLNTNVTQGVNHAPVMTAPDFTAGRNQNIAASSLFSVSDADNDAIVRYQFWDSTMDPASGHWVVNGVAERGGTGCGPSD